MGDIKSLVNKLHLKNFFALKKEILVWFIVVALMVVVGISWEKALEKDEKEVSHQPLVADSSRQISLSRGLFEIQKEWEQEFEEKLESLISKVVGARRAIIRVNVTLNAQERDIVEEIVDPDSVVLKGQTREVSEKTRILSNNVVPPRGNTQKELVTVNNELSRTTTKIRELAGGIKRVSVAVLVDEVMYTKDGKNHWRPRSQQELHQLENLVKSTIGFTAKRGDSVKIESLRFQSSHLENNGFYALWGRKSLWLKWLLVGLIFIFFLLLVFHPLVSHIATFFRPEVVEDSDPQLETKKSQKLEPVASPQKLESELLRDKIIGLLNKDEKKAMDALNMWLTKKES